MTVQTGDNVLFRMKNPGNPEEIFEHRCHVVKVPDSNGIIVGIDSDDYIWAITPEEIVEVA